MGDGYTSDKQTTEGMTRTWQPANPMTDPTSWDTRWTLSPWQSRMWGMSDYPAYVRYAQNGGKMSYNAWRAAGRPTSDTELTPRAISALKSAGYYNESTGNIEAPAGLRPTETAAGTEPAEGEEEPPKNPWGYTAAEWESGARDWVEFQLAQTNAMNDAAQRAWERNFLAEQQRLAAQFGMKDDVRAQQAEEFELWRNRMLSNLTGPANTVARWFVQHKTNPYVQKPSEKLEEDIKQAKMSLEQSWQDFYSTPGRTEETGYGSEVSKMDESQLKEGASAIKEAEARYKMMVESENEPLRMPTPDWLPQYAPGVGDYLTLDKPLNVQTPSGQQLSKLSPSRADYIAGAIDFLGGRPWADALAETQSMLTRNPSLGRRNAPARQFRV